MRQPIDPRRGLEVAIAAVRAGGQHALQNRHRGTEIHAAFRHDVKLQLDLECQAKVLNVIRGQFPDHRILGEEDEQAVADRTGHAARKPPVWRDDAETDTSPLWIVDPIDGTVNFFHGLPLWCCSVALQEGGHTVAGAVYAPERQALYTATRDGPALLNERPIAVSLERQLAASMLLTGLSPKGGPDVVSPELVDQFAQAVQKIRVLGSAALDICRVAQGHAEAYWEPAIHVWDMAAASLIVERAGGRTEVIRRWGTHVSFLATNGHVHAALRQLIPDAPS